MHPAPAGAAFVRQLRDLGLAIDGHRLARTIYYGRAASALPVAMVAPASPKTPHERLSPDQFTLGHRPRGRIRLPHDALDAGPTARVHNCVGSSHIRPKLNANPMGPRRFVPGLWHEEIQLTRLAAGIEYSGDVTLQGRR